MRPLLLFAISALCTSAIAQTPAVTVDLEPAVIKPGQISDVTLSVSVPDGTQPAGLNWTLQYPPSAIENLVVKAGPATIAAKKTLQCRSVSGTTKCVVFGLNRNTLASGTLATISFTAREGAGNSQPGIQVADVVVANLSGSPIRCVASNRSVAVRQ